MTDPDSKWSRLSAALREEGVGSTNDEHSSPPPGFATRIVARSRSESRANATGLRLWRQWSLLGAGTAVLLCGTLFLVRPQVSEQIVPVPLMEDLPPLASS